MKLEKITRVCKLCFKDIKENNLTYLINPNFSLCSSCYERLRPKFTSFMIGKYKGIAIYEYDEDIRAMLYQLKGCYDYELRHIFLERYVIENRLIYHNYYVIPIPSYIKDDETRGFNHVEEIFSSLKLKVLKIIEKTDHFKQADHNKEQRAEISKHLKIIGNPDLTNKKVLLVDDVYSTGSTMKAAISLVEKLHPKKIRILVMSKTNDEKYMKGQD